MRHTSRVPAQYHETSPERPRRPDVWEADRFSVRETMDRNRRSPWLKLCADWQAADFYGRAWITFQLTVAVLCGLLAGLATTVIVVALVVAA